MPDNLESRILHKAFISYSHAADGRLAPVLQSALQSFAKPWYKIRSFSVFRDDTNLSVTPALWPAIERALASSEFFILLASPEAAASKWVRQEVDFWLTNRSADKLLIVQTGGQIKWDDGAGDFDWAGTTAIPDALMKRFGDEPFYLDLSWAKSPDEHLSLRHSDFRKAVLKLAATLSGRDMAELDSAEVRQHRKNIRVAWAAGIGLLALTVIAVISALLFLQQKKEAERERNTAFARQLAAESTAQLSENPDLALLLSVEGLRTQSNIETRGGLLRALQHSPLLSTFLHGHRDMVRRVAVQPGGTVFASGGDDGTIILWDFATRRPLGPPLAANRGAVTSLAFSPDGKTLVSGNGESGDSVVVRWDVETRGMVEPTLPGSGDTVFDMAFSADGEILAAGGGGRKITFWDVRRGQPASPPLEVKADVQGLAFHPRDKVLAVGTDDSTVILWDYQTRRAIGHELKAPGKEHVDQVAFGRGGDLIAVGYHDGTLIIWDVKKQEPLKTSVGEASGLEILGLDFSPDGDTVAAGFSDGTITLFSAATGKPVSAPLTGHRLAVGGVAFSSDGKFLVSGGYEGAVILWDLGARVPLGRRFDNFGGRQVETVAIGQNERVVGATSEGNAVTLWDVETGQRLGEPLDGGQGEVSKIALEPRGRFLAAAYKNQKLILWDVATGRSLTPVIEAHKSAVYSLVFSPDGNTFASSDDGAIYMWDTATQRALGPPMSHGKGLVRVVFAPDGRTLVSGGEDGFVKFWNVPDGRSLGQTATGQDGMILSIAISPDGKTVATGGPAAEGSKVYLWDVGTRRVLGEPLQGHRGPVQALAFSPDGATLASGAWDYRIVFWDTATRRPVGLALTGHEGGIECLLFGADGKRLVSAALDDAVIVWDVDVGSWEERACRIANRNITCAEWTQFFTDTPYHPTCRGLPSPRDCS